MEFHRNISNDEKLVILFSGGLDSVIAYYYALHFFDEKNVLGLFVDIGQPYASFEKESVLTAKTLTNMNIQLLDFPFIAHPNYLNNVPTPTNQVIPGRNMTLATIAANFGTTIWINALFGELKEEMVDKNFKFFKEASEVLSYTFNYKIIVESPFWNFTKTYIVSLAKQLGIHDDVLKATCSCYNPIYNKGIRYFCGDCLTCFKRKVSMVNNNIEENYVKDPFKSWYAKSVYDRRFEIEQKLITTYKNAYQKVNLSFDDIPKYCTDSTI